jgi:hypothetical protein
MYRREACGRAYAHGGVLVNLLPAEPDDTPAHLFEGALPSPIGCYRGRARMCSVPVQLDAKLLRGYGEVNAVLAYRMLPD